MLLRNRWLKDRINIKKGISGTGAALGETIEYYDKPISFLEQGDFVLKDMGINEILKQLSSPIAYDIWYLNHHINILSRSTDRYDYIPFIDSNGEDVEDSCITGQFSFLGEKLQKLSPMTFLRDIGLLTLGEESIKPELWLTKREYFINLIPYEMRFTDVPFQFDSNGADINYGFSKEDCAGYFAFPAGQLGVMEVVSIIKEHEIEQEKFELTEEEKPSFPEGRKAFFSHADKYTGQNRCVGDHIFESGYVIPVEKRKNIEYLNVSVFPESAYKKISPQSWIRYWFHRTDTFPVPGEFIGIVVKPLALPPHAVWFQKTSPFLYAGNWIETNQMTSGIVIEKTYEADRTDGGIGTEYKVKIHGWEIYCYASDGMDYELGERVAILKLNDVKQQSVNTSFLWSDMYTMEEMDKERRTYDYLIVPISFYKEEKEA